MLADPTLLVQRPRKDDKGSPGWSSSAVVLFLTCLWIGLSILVNDRYCVFGPGDICCLCNPRQRATSRFALAKPTPISACPALCNPCSPGPRPATLLQRLRNHHLSHPRRLSSKRLIGKTHYSCRNPFPWFPTFFSRLRLSRIQAQSNIRC